MKKFMERFKTPIVAAVIILAMFVIVDQRKEIQECRIGATMLEGGDIAKAQYIDSINNELFIQTTNVTRYEIALEMLREVDTAAARKFEDALNTIE